MERNSRLSHVGEAELSFTLDPVKNGLNVDQGIGEAVEGDLAAKLKALGSRMGKTRVQASGGLLVRGAIDFNFVLGVCARGDAKLAIRSAGGVWSDG